MSEHSILLVVDDIFFNRILLTKIINETGHKCIEAKNGKEAIQILEERDDINLIFMDIEMPVMNGFETTQMIRTEFDSPYRNMPIIAITAHNPEEFKENHKTIGFSDIITKPYTPPKIEEIINKYLGD